MGSNNHHRRSTTELDSHANMVVVGAQATIVSRTGRLAEVRAFSDKCSKLEGIPIVDAAFAYDCPKTMQSYLLFVKNALYVQDMQHNLIPPFIMREAGLTVNDIPRIHLGDEVTRESHSILSEEVDMRIPLRLRGIFSCFPTRALSPREIEDPGSMTAVMLTPDATTWNPHDDSWDEREDAFLDYQGELIEARPRKRSRLLEEDDYEVYDINVTGERWEEAIDAVCSANDIAMLNPQDYEVSHLEGDIIEDTSDDDPIDIPQHFATASVADLTGLLDPETLADALGEKWVDAQISMAAGSSTDCNPQDAGDCDLFVDVDAIAATAGIPTGAVTKEMLSKVWRITEDEARRTLEVTTQLNRQSADSTLSRNFGTNDRQTRYKRINSFFFMDTFYVTAKAKSVRGFTMMHLFVSDKGFVKVYGMKSESDILSAVRMFCKEVGAPNAFVCDPHQSNTEKGVRQFCNKIGTTLRILEERTQHANRAELFIGLMKEAVRKDIRATHAPLRFWCFAAERRAAIFTLTAKNRFQLQGQNPYLATLGEMGDISHLCNFGFYEWVYFRQGSAPFPKMTEELGRCLGPTKNEANEMAQWVLQLNGHIVPRRSLRRLSAQEASVTNETEVRKRSEFDAAIKDRYGDSFALGPDAQLDGTMVQSDDEFDPSNPQDFDPFDFTPYESEVEAPATVPEADIIDAAGKPINQQSVADLLLNAEVLLPQGETTQMAKVVRRAVDDDGKLVGNFNENPILNTLVYEVQFPDGAIKPYAANIIAENILTQVDSSGRHAHSLEKILDMKKDHTALTKDDAFVTTKSGRRLRQTTVGWSCKVKWRDGNTQWVPLRIMKESNPVDVAMYARERGVAKEPAFAWWVPHTIKKAARIVASINSRVAKRTHKYGIEIPTTVAHAIEIDRRNGNTFWQDAIRKEMYNVSVAFKILEDHEHVPVGWKRSSGHLVFDVKMDFTRKARWVKDGHKTPDPEASYAGVVSRESIRIALTYAALNDINVLAADIRNAYLQAPSSEKHYIICGPEFGLENEGKRALILRALYGGKAAGRDFWHHLRSCMKDTLGFESCLADPDVWMRKVTREDGSKVWEYVLLYVDDCLVISDNAERVLRDEIGKFFELKPDSIGPPDIYLGGQMRLRDDLDNGVKAWAFGSAQYVKAAVKNVEEHLQKKGKVLPARAKSPLSNGYRPEIDISAELSPVDASYYQSLIGILRWMVELGRVDICCEVSMMSSHLALPRKGHLDEVFHIFGYLKKHHNAEMVFDPTEPSIDESKFCRQDWSHTVYGKVKEELPPDMPEPCGMGFRMRTFVDSDHAGESLTRRSRTGFLVYLNSAPIHWWSKKQTSCETSTFGSEFVAMKQAAEYIRGLRYKLRMMGIPCEEPTFIFGDNQSVLANTTAPDSQLKKKSNSIAYHFVREGCARDEWRTTYVNTHDNPADLLTKPLPSGEKRSKFIRMLLRYLADGK